MKALKALVICVCASSVLAAAPEYLYRLEFDDGKAPGFNYRVRSMSKWSFEDGALVQENLNEKYAAVYGIGHHSWKDFEIRLRVKFIKPRIDATKGTLFAVKVWNIRFDCLPGAVSIWYKKPGAKRGSAVHYRDKNEVIDPKHWYEMRLRYSPSLAAVTIDGKTVAELKEVPPRPKGTGGPVTVYFGNMKCALDYFRVVDMEGPGK